MGVERLRDEATPDLVRRLLDGVQALFDRQIELARQELREDLRQAIRAAVVLAIGAALLFVALVSFLIAVFLGIEQLVPGWGWVAALATTLILGLVGGLLVMRGIDQVRMQPLARTRETLREDAEWARHQLTSNERSSSSAMIFRPPSRSSNAGPGVL